MNIPSEVLESFRVSSPEDLGGRVNHHWAVWRGPRKLILRRVGAHASESLGYEFRVLEALHARGWPVARAVEEPSEESGATWCLLEHLDGQPAADHGSEPEQRERGRLLAALHHDLDGLTDLGQRSGWVEVGEVVKDASLYDELRAFESLFPREARILRWHAERARDLYGEIGQWDAAPRLVIHGDFAPWNLLYRDGRLSGILDFETSHLDLAVADFALSWRGRYDGVIAGYEEVRPLSDLEWALLVPTFWAWLMLGLAAELRAMNWGAVDPRAPEWSTRLLLRRTPLMGRESAPYRDGE
ncbi:MAG: phosphotransferase [Candidatus Dormibacteraeota bacterium]|nr:phosphotransferase [Candidatus Dormibacteraeota bacterium]